ncbi:hypothetical protein FMM80_00685 [Schaedlerella arabinosiphila]|uniref:Uncharacterized protein n=1 Tax=Schaedlerella arabinosiphila TaxID=2044587 RepID=A0A9X5H4J5_9FIRM|nr:hypothetical protein [Schaedlerella arabinosiphila]KAI4438935.1 hypothetical protein C824_001415 [Schaedlerella arabinosiphila]NDO67329.1 hypothetical protein [Schaedlerella arabinosiphila]
MAKKINFEKINAKAMAQVQNFAAARVSIAKEDRRFKEIIKPLNKKLDKIFEDRENDLAQGIDKEEVFRKHSTIETENAIRKATAEHREAVKPLNAALKATYEFIPASLYTAYEKKIEEGKRGDFLESIKKFLENLGIEEVSQSALCKLSERISDKLGVSCSNSKKLLDEGKFASTLNGNQFSKLFMSVFCDILIAEEALTVEF